MPLTRGAIVNATLMIADTEGLDSVSMRRVARELGVEAMSLYHHVRSKEDLLDSVAEAVYATIEFPPLESRWQDSMMVWCAAFREALLSHPNCVPLLTTRPVLGDNGFAVIEAALGALGDLGLEPEAARRTLNVAVSFVFGHALMEVGARAELAGRSEEEVAQIRKGVSASEFPMVAATIGERVPDRDTEFTQGVLMLIAGMERMLGL